MSAEDFELPVAPSDYGRHRREQWMASLRANSEMMSQAAMAAHQPDHNEITRSTHGIFGALTGEQLAANVAARQAVVGSAYDARPLQRQGGLYDPADYLCGPVPPQRDLRQVSTPGGQPTTVSPLWAHMQGRQ